MERRAENNVDFSDPQKLGFGSASDSISAVPPFARLRYLRIPRRALLSAHSRARTAEPNPLCFRSLLTFGNLRVYVGIVIVI